MLPEMRRNPAVRKVIDWIAGVTGRHLGALYGTSSHGGLRDDNGE